MTQEAFAKALTEARREGGNTLDALVEQHLPLVRMLAKRIAWHGVDREELFQQGCIGLITAVRRFDPERGVAFSTYAAPLILGEMRALCRADGSVHIPRMDREKKARIHHAQSALFQRLGREPTVTELAEALGMEPSELTLLMENVTVSSLDACSGEEGEPLADRIADQGNPWLERLMLEDLFSRLPHEDQTLLTLRFRDGLSQAEAARRMGVHQSYISRHESALTTRLKRLWYDG